MGKYKDFIKEAVEKQRFGMCSQVREEIKKELPELFPKEEFKVGDWVRLIDDHENGEILICITNLKKSKAFGFTRSGQWTFSEEYQGWTFNCNPENWRKASKQEIESHLIEEAKRRGYNTKEFKSIYKYSDSNVEPVEDWSYKKSEDRLYSAPYLRGGKVVYEKGQWAKIIDDTPKDIQQLVEKYGKKEVIKWIKD